jgi:hypothetical protein
VTRRPIQPIVVESHQKVFWTICVTRGRTCISFEGCKKLKNKGREDMVLCWVKYVQNIEKASRKRGRKKRGDTERYDARTKEENSRRGRNVVACPRKWVFAISRKSEFFKVHFYFYGIPRNFVSKIPQNSGENTARNYDRDTCQTRK